MLLVHNVLAVFLMKIVDYLYMEVHFEKSMHWKLQRLRSFVSTASVLIAFSIYKNLIIYSQIELTVHGGTPRNVGVNSLICLYLLKTIAFRIW